MKKLSLLVVMLVAMAIGVKAQGHYIIPTIGFNESSVVLSGPEFEINEPGYKLNMNEYVKMRTGLSIGVNYRYEFNKPFLIEAGIHFNQYGYSMKDVKHNDLKVMWDWNVRLNHFSVPVMFGYKFVIGKSRVFSITPKIGLQFGYYTNVKEHYMFYDAFGHEVDHSSSDKADNGFDVAEISAVEFGWKLNDMLDIFVAVNDRYSFKNMANEKNSSSHNFSIGANVGLKVRLGK